MEQPIRRGSVLDAFSCNNKDPLEVKLMSERARCTSGLKWFEDGEVNSLKFEVCLICFQPRTTYSDIN